MLKVALILKSFRLPNYHEILSYLEDDSYIHAYFEQLKRAFVCSSRFLNCTIGTKSCEASHTVFYKLLQSTKTSFSVFGITLDDTNSIRKMLRTE